MFIFSKLRVLQESGKSHGQTGAESWSAITGDLDLGRRTGPTYQSFQIFDSFRLLLPHFHQGIHQSHQWSISFTGNELWQCTYLRTRTPTTRIIMYMNNYFRISLECHPTSELDLANYWDQNLWVNSTC